jgi:hypothetical protein
MTDQAHMFSETAEDLPLFSGTPQRAQAEAYTPQQAAHQTTMDLEGIKHAWGLKRQYPGHIVLVQGEDGGQYETCPEDRGTVQAVCGQTTFTPGQIAKAIAKLNRAGHLVAQGEKLTPGTSEYKRRMIEARKHQG